MHQQSPDHRFSVKSELFTSLYTTKYLNLLLKFVSKFEASTLIYCLTHSERTNHKKAIYFQKRITKNEDQRPKPKTANIGKIWGLTVRWQPRDKTFSY